MSSSKPEGKSPKGTTQVIISIKSRLATPDGAKQLQDAIEHVNAVSSKLQEAGKVDSKSLNKPVTF